MHIPVSERGGAVGVLELLLPEAPDAQILNYLRSAGHALAYVITTARQSIDLYEPEQRSTASSRFSTQLPVLRPLTS